MNIVAFIPARSGSKSIKDKNIKKLGGKSLLTWSIESAFKSDIQRVIVNTDSEEYGKIAQQYGAEAMLRPASLAQDKTSMLDVLRSEIPKIDPKPDLVVLLQTTTPFRKELHIKLGIAYLTENLDEYDSLIVCERVPEKWNPYAMILQTPSGKGMLFRKLIGWKEKVKGWWTGKKFVGPNLEGFPINQRMTRRQDLPQAWLPTGSVYLFKTDNLKKGSIYGEKVMILETESELNINDKDDWEEAEQYLKRKE